MTTAQNKLTTLFNIHPGEGRLVTLLLAYSFFIGAARIFTRSAAMGLFLSQYSAGALPYVYIGISIIVTALSYVYLKLGQKLALSRLLAATLIFLLASLLLFWFGLSISQSSTLVFVLPIWYEVLWTLTSLAFWNLAGRLLNVRQGKRLFAFVSSGEAVAILLGGLLVPFLVRISGTVNLLIASAAAVLGILLVLAAISRSFSQQLDLPLEKASTEATGSAKSVFKSHYVLLLCSLFGVVVLVYFFIDAIFYAQAEVRYPTQESLTAFVGVFFGVIGLVGLVARLFVTGWLIDRFGVRRTVLVGPVVVAVCVALLALTGTFSAALLVVFGLASLAKMFSLVLMDSTDLASLNIFYQPLSPARRTQVQTLVEGIVYPLTVGLAGVGLVLLTTVLNLGIVPVVYTTLFFVLVWLATAIATGRNYPAALRQALAKRKISGEGLVLDDESSRKVLLGALQSDKPETVLHALTMLEESESVDLAGALPSLLSHPSPDVRLAALRIIEEQQVNTALEAVQNCMQNETKPSVRAAALRVLASLGQDEAIEQIYPCLEDANLQICSEAIVALLRYTGIEVAVMAEGKLLQLAVSNNPAERIAAAKIVGRVSGRNLDQLLMQLLKDENIQVRRAALLAAGQGNYPNVWPLVIEQVASVQLRNVAAAALVYGGVSTLSHISTAFAQSTQNADTRRRLARVVGRIGGPEATLFLRGHIAYPNSQVRTEIFAALHRCGYRAENEAHAAVVTRLKAEAEQAAETVAALVDFQAQAAKNNAGFSLLTDGLNYEMLNSRRRIFWLLSFVYPTDTILQARYNLNLDVPEKKAYALEMLDLTLSAELKPVLFPLFEDISSSRQHQRFAKIFPQSPQTIEQRLQALLTCPPRKQQPLDAGLCCLRGGSA